MYVRTKEQLFFFQENAAFNIIYQSHNQFLQAMNKINDEN